MKFSCLLLLMSFVCIKCSVYTGYSPPYPYNQWNYQNPYQVKPIPQQRPIIPGSPQWKRLELIKKYQAFQRSRTSDVSYGPKSKEITEFEKQSLLHHNSHRKLHQVSDLIIDHSLSRQAADYARKLATDMKIAHSSPSQRQDQQENIAAGCKVSGPGLTAFEAVKYWYQTVCHNNWISPKPDDKSRPFANMVWKSSKTFGIGFASFKTKDGFNCSVIVARYFPHDGVVEESTYSDNVNKGLFEPANCQYVMDRDKPDFIQPALEKCKATNDHHGQMLDSSCTFSQLFGAFGASRRKGKLSFRVVL